MLEKHFYTGLVEAGTDEAGRGCLAGPVYAAAVILPDDFEHPLLNDSKQLTDHQRRQLREIIEREAVAWAIGIASAAEIDKINILNASILAMHRALDGLSIVPQAVIVDGNRFKTWRSLPYTTIVKGDGKLMPIAAASILAKTYRDDCMIELAKDFPQYQWQQNKGYPTKAHRDAIRQHGLSPHHRLTFTQLPPVELEIPF